MTSETDPPAGEPDTKRLRITLEIGKQVLTTIMITCVLSELVTMFLRPGRYKYMWPDRVVPFGMFRTWISTDMGMPMESAAAASVPCVCVR
jgi:hypothetical protein